MKKRTLYSNIKETLAVASQLIITAPLKLPPKVVAVAKYVALALGVLEAGESAWREIPRSDQVGTDHHPSQKKGGEDEDDPA